MKSLTPEQMEKLCKHRLCKKLRLSEFQGFGFSFELTYDRSALSHDDALDHLIGSTEAQNWVSGDGGSPEQVEISGYPCLTRVGNLDEAGRESTHLRPEAQPRCKIFEVGPLSDCWHNFFE